MPVPRRYFAPGQLQFITSGVYRRLKLFDSQCLRFMFVEGLREYRQEKGLLLIGWVAGADIWLLMSARFAAANRDCAPAVDPDRFASRNRRHQKPDVCASPPKAGVHAT
jgi:hypothetical protein